ncbi:helix-turn-helix transcriptional regulator [Streptomyces sp. WI04-05B]|uniref:helix-turn-helix transcriptional regulator n=1 Tax=Streptomyces TaxID=1883 RepID=UPI0029A98CFC|nr:MULTISPECIES: AAA family ATPase [unclassified Streptomyces]MDX2545389.1 AAA family ATPase [Streptomyces sp. WI04-05B]MDX2588116.1 AAA family ATPase [Streptomyces sp. WI04-05A]
MTGARQADLVGREPEMSRLRAVLGDRNPRCAHLLEISGDPGIGKTHLLAAFRAHARRSGWTVLTGGASGLGDTRPFALFSEAVRTALTLTRGPDPADPATDGRASACPGRLAEIPDGDDHRLVEAMSDLLWNTARRQPLVLALEDLHWADDTSVRLLHHLLRSPRPGVPLVIAYTLRPRQCSDRLAACLADARDSFRGERFALAPLTRRAADVLVREVATARHGDLYEAAEGNPFYLKVLARASRPGPTDGPAVPLPLTDSALALALPALARETASLNADHMAVAQAASVLGDDFDPSDLGALTDRDPGTVAEALDALVARDLIRADPAHGRRFRFRHPVVRALHYMGTPPGSRQRIHARAEQVLRQAGTPAVERAPHAARSAQPGDLETIRLLRDAAEQILGTDPETAASWLGTALRLLPENSDPGLRTRLMSSRARALGVSGQLQASQELLTEISRRREGEPTRHDTELVAFQAMIERYLGNCGHAEALLTAELASLPDHAAALGDPLRLELATISALHQAFTRSQALSQGVLGRAIVARDPALHMAATIGLAHNSAFAGDIPALLHWVNEASHLVDSATDTELAPHLDALSRLSWAETVAERHGNALRHTARGSRLAEASGQLFVLPYLQLTHAYASISVGRLDDTLRSAEYARDLTRRTERPAVFGLASALQAWALLFLDGPDAAASTAEQALQEIGAGGWLWGVTAGVLATIRLAQGRSEECLDLTWSATEHDSHPGATRTVRTTWYALRAQATAALGHTDAAGEWALRALEGAELLGLPGQRGHAALAQATSAADPVPWLRRAIGEFHSGGFVLRECQARLMLARELVARESPGEALAEAHRAKALSEASGARHLHQQAVNIQRLLGARAPRPERTASTSSSTTASVSLPDMSCREREITRLVSLGMSNNEIAGALFLSPKTVEGHLTRIFRKTGVRSRGALVATLAQATR